ncbi:MAG: hypothetical protein FJ020_04870 [Chloroflexi bacterium]|nr:hypothetical protein [Chloroflexota bacterium]
MKAIYLWVSRLSAVAGLVCVVLAGISGLMIYQFKILAQTYVDLAVVSFLFAILAHLYYSKD